MTMKKKIGSILVFSLVVLAALSMGVETPPTVVEDYESRNIEPRISIHITRIHFDTWGNILHIDHHPGNLTDYGANWIADILGDADGDQADCIGLTNSTTAYADNWVVLPDEITTEGLSREQGTYVDDGVGAWNITYTFSVTGSNSCQRAGLYTLTSGSNLVATDTFALTNVENADSLQIIFQISVTDV